MFALRILISPYLSAAAIIRLITFNDNHFSKLSLLTAGTSSETTSNRATGMSFGACFVESGCLRNRALGRYLLSDLYKLL